MSMIAGTARSMGVTVEDKIFTVQAGRFNHTGR